MQEIGLLQQTGIRDWGAEIRSGCNAPTRNVKNIAQHHAEQPAKKTFDILPHPRVASVEPPWLETPDSRKCTYKQDILCNAIERIAQLKCSFCGHAKGTF